MAVNTTGNHGQPIIDNPARRRADMQAIADYAGIVGNRVLVGSYGEMTAGFRDRFGFDPWDGLEALNTDTRDLYVFNATANAWEDPDSPTIAYDTIFTPSTGWKNGSDRASIVQSGPHLASVFFSFQRTGGALNPGANGNLDDVTIGRLSVSPWGRSQPLVGAYLGRLTQYMVDTTGLVRLTAAAPGNTISTGDSLSAAGLLLI